VETGTVTVNDQMSSFAEPGAIWGGVKQNGIGTKLKTLFSLAPHMSRILATLPLSNLIRSLPKLFKK